MCADSKTCSSLVNKTEISAKTVLRSFCKSRRKKMITIYWHCLGMTEADEIFVAGALKELAQHLKDAPIKLPVSIKRLGDKPKLAEKICERLNKLNDQSYEFSACSAEIADTFASEEGVVQSLLIYCRPDSHIAQAARRKESVAKWGATCGSFSAVYPPKGQLKTKFTIWHEALHLLGLDECYDENTLRRNCKRETCVMQYEPPSGVDENWPSPLCDNLCDKQKEKLRELAKKVEQRCRAKNNS